MNFTSIKRKKKASNNLRRQRGENIGKINDKGIIFYVVKSSWGMLRKTTSTQ